MVKDELIFYCLSMYALQSLLLNASQKALWPLPQNQFFGNEFWMGIKDYSVGFSGIVFSFNLRVSWRVVVLKSVAFYVPG